MPVGRGTSDGGQFGGGLFEILREARTKLRDGTAREKERDGEGLSLELAEADGLAEFIGELIIEQRMVLGGHLSWRRGRGGSGRGECDFAPGGGNLINPTGILIDRKSERDFVARAQAGKLGGFFGRERHGYSGHVIGNGLVLDEGGPAIRLDFLHHAANVENAR